jgi:hypothetical protein
MQNLGEKLENPINSCGTYQFVVSGLELLVFKLSNFSGIA